MGKILKRSKFNNGYGCSCCRKDWETTEWIDENEMVDFRILLTQVIENLNANASDGGCVGIFYEKDGKTLYGIDSNIYKIGWEFYAVFGGDADYDYENELLIKGYEGDSNKKSYSVDEIITIYSNSCV